MRCCCNTGTGSSRSCSRTQTRAPTTSRPRPRCRTRTRTPPEPPLRRQPRHKRQTIREGVTRLAARGQGDDGAVCAVVVPSHVTGSSRRMAATSHTTRKEDVPRLACATHVLRSLTWTLYSSSFSADHGDVKGTAHRARDIVPRKTAHARTKQFQGVATVALVATHPVIH